MSLMGLRIRIRPTRHEDLPFLQELWNDGAVMRYQGYPHGLHITGADMERWWQTAGRSRGSLSSLPTPHAIIETIGGAPLGEITYSLDAQGRASIDLKLAPRHWKQGYGLEATRVFMREVFATTGVKKIIVEPSPDNEPALRLLRQNCFHPAPTENHPDRWECERRDFAHTIASSAAAA